MWIVFIAFCSFIHADVFSLLSGRVDGKLKVEVGATTEISSKGKDHKHSMAEVSKSIKSKRQRSHYIYSRWKNYKFEPTTLFFDSKTVSLDQLKSLKLGYGYRQKSWGLFSDFGSEGDKLFTSDNSTVSVTGFVEKNSWIYFLNYSNNRTFLNHIPLPGIAYKQQSEDKKWTYYIGAPFLFVSWNPIKPLVLSYYTLLPYTHKLNAMYFIKFIRIFAGIQAGPTSYIASFIESDKARIYYDEKSVYLGLVVPFSRKSAVVFKINHNLSQKLSLSTSYQKLYSNEVRYSDSTDLSLNLKFNF